MTYPRLLIVGSTGSSHIGESLLRGAARLGVEAEICDTAPAWKHGTIGQKFVWEFLGKRPIALNRFSRIVIESCVRFRPNMLLSTGTSPLSRDALAEIKKLGVRCMNFSTDDPFNPLMHSPWFLRALPLYDAVFSPRAANLDELRLCGCSEVVYLPFGYDPELFYPEGGSDAETSDLFFAGTADPIRIEYVSRAVDAGLKVRVHGNYWNRNAKTRPFARGQADIPTLRRGIGSCKVALCLVRHENRDGNSMRSYEVPAVGACMVVEDTEEHREIFGEEGLRVVYFRSPAEMVAKTQELLGDAETRHRLRDSAHVHITEGKNTYADRLAVMLGQG